jgi:hypothetical protein
MSSGVIVSDEIVLREETPNILAMSRFGKMYGTSEYLKTCPCGA